MITADQIAPIIWQEYARRNVKPAPTTRETWGYKAAERIADLVNVLQPPTQAVMPPDLSGSTSGIR